MENQQQVSKNWRTDINIEFPEPLPKFLHYAKDFRRCRRKDSWTKRFKAKWVPLHHWKLPRKIRHIREGKIGYISLLEAPLGGNTVTARLVLGIPIDGTDQRQWQQRKNWDRMIYGKSVHLAFKGWARYLLDGPDGRPFIAYEGEFFRLLGGRYSTEVSTEIRESVVRQLIAMRFVYTLAPVAPTPMPISNKKSAKRESKPKSIRPQTRESRRTHKAKVRRLQGLATADYLDNGGHLTLSLPPDPTMNLDEKVRRWRADRTAWCKGLERIARRYGIQLDWFLEVSKRRCPLLRRRVEVAHYHMLWRRHECDRLTFKDLRSGFLTDVRKTATKIWNINEYGLLDRPISNEHHMANLRVYLSSPSSDACEIAWGRYFGRINPSNAMIRAILTKDQHFQLRRIQARALNHPLPPIAVDISGPMKSENLLQSLEAMGVSYDIVGVPLVERDLVTVVSHLTNTASSPNNTGKMRSAPFNPHSVRENSDHITSGLNIHIVKVQGNRCYSDCEDGREASPQPTDRRPIMKYLDGKAVVSIPMSQIEPDVNQPRKDFTSVEILASSMAKHGQLQPIIVTSLGAERYRIVEGGSRYIAAQNLKWDALQCIIVEIDEQYRRDIQFTANTVRSELNPFELADEYHRIMTDHDLTQAALATTLSKSESTVSAILKLRTLPDQIRTRLIPVCRESGTEALALIARAKSAEAMDELVERVVKGSTVRELRKTRNKSKKAISSKKPVVGESIPSMPTESLPIEEFRESDPVLTHGLAAEAEPSIDEVIIAAWWDAFTVHAVVLKDLVTTLPSTLELNLSTIAVWVNSHSGQVINGYRVISVSIAPSKSVHQLIPITHDRTDYQKKLTEKLAEHKAMAKR